MEYYVVAARWWIDTIKSGDASNFVMGHDSPAYLASLLAMYGVQSTSPRISQKTYEDFEKCLIEVIQDEVNRYGSCTLECDYAPCGGLERAAQKANISTNGFPWKTYMKIKPHLITVQKGYGAPDVEIFKA